MVLLGGVFRLLGHYNLSAYQRAMARRAGIEDLLPLTTLNRKKSRTREPAIGWKRCYRSVLLQRTLRLRVTLATQRLINRVGGFDRYIYYTPEEELRSPLARTLKHRMNDLVAKHPAVEPPRLDKRNPKPVPKNLCAGLKPVEVCNMTRFVYLG